MSSRLYVVRFVLRPAILAARRSNLPAAAATAACRSPAAPPLPTTKLAVQGEDPWLALDKLQHFLFCFAVTAAGYLAARARERLRRHRLPLGCAAGVVAGILKEVGDVLGLWPGALSIRDLGADAVGVAAALAALVAAEARRRPLAGQQQGQQLVLVLEQKGVV